MKSITFKEFIKDYREYYEVDEVRFSYSDMEEILFCIYDTDNYEIDYDNKVIELF